MRPPAPALSSYGRTSCCFGMLTRLICSTRCCPAVCFLKIILLSLCTCCTKGTLLEHNAEHSVHMWQKCYHSFGIIELRSSLVQCRRLRIV